ncbi:class I SAM-dependent methyltransferase [Caulobacter mirabilis]|uniref:Methyltransferase n=1 Tax=Caulobacter mirabilis TaxID=69666 RepID=A0A2D2AXN3_9CAUL|nr:class I SAM-dependent methyltransferase [Caulobacter mirabilis]ATQ42766.1 methyltransferase [Caulobacter mirabilis]
MAYRFTLPLAGVLAIALATTAVAGSDVPDNLLSAVANPARPEAQRARDAARHPAEILAFAGVKTGDKVGDFLMGGGYFTRILSGAVGPTGKVYAFQADEFISFMADYGKWQDETAKFAPNIVPVRSSIGVFATPEPVDLIFTAQNYHDLHLGRATPEQIAAINKRLYAALKPGGVLLVIDHYAADGSGDRDSSKLHRIDIAMVKAELEAAGFKLEGQSDLLRNPADPRTASVFDPAIQGKTDQFVLKFRKPK